MTHEIAKFEYSQLDMETASFLQSKENNMREIVGKAYTELGRELAEAQAELSRQGGDRSGTFGRWLEHIGMKKDAANRMINRYNLIVANCDDGTGQLIEDLPVSLSYEISKPSAESTEAKAQAKAEVLAGDVASLKEYRERIAELERRAEQAEASAQTAQRSEEITRRQLDELTDVEPEVVVKTEYIADIETERKVRRYEELFGDVSMYDGQTTRVTNGDAITYAVFEFTQDVRQFIEKYGHLTHFASEFSAMIDEGKAEYGAAISDMRRFMSSIERVMDVGQTTIING